MLMSWTMVLVEVERNCVYKAYIRRVKPIGCGDGLIMGGKVRRIIISFVHQDGWHLFPKIQNFGRRVGRVGKGKTRCPVLFGLEFEVSL